MATLTDRDRRGWTIVVLCFFGLALTASARGTIGLVMPTWEAELGWTRGFVSSVGAMMLVSVAVVAPLAGNFQDRFGPRPLLVLGMAMIALGTGLTAVIDSAAAFFVTFGIVTALGFGFFGNHTIAPTLAWFFEKNRGLATGIATAGLTAGQLVIVPLLALLLQSAGWRLGYVLLAVAALAVAPILWLLIPKRDAILAGTKAPAEPEAPIGERLRFLLRSPVFHALFWSFVICGFTTSGTVEVHLIPYAISCGFPPLTSATAYGVLAGVNMVAMMLSGYLTDRMNRPLLLGLIYIGRGLCFLLLMRIAGDVEMLFLFAVAFGIFDYSTVPPTASLVASHLGRRIMGLAMGLLSAGHALGGAAGAFMAGILYDLYQQYDAVWIASVAVAVAAGFMAFTVRENRQPAEPKLQPA
jgi:MFS family permease